VTLTPLPNALLTSPKSQTVLRSISTVELAFIKPLKKKQKIDNKLHVVAFEVSILILVIH